MYICISIYRDVYYVYVPGHARAHTRLYTGAGPDHFERLSDCVAAPAAMPFANAYRQRLLQAPHSVAALPPVRLIEPHTRESAADGNGSALIAATVQRGHPMRVPT